MDSPKEREQSVSFSIVYQLQKVRLLSLAKLHHLLTPKQKKQDSLITIIARMSSSTKDESILGLLPDDLLIRLVVSCAGFAGCMDFVHFRQSCKRTYLLLNHGNEVLLKDLRNELRLPPNMTFSTLEQLCCCNRLWKALASGTENRIGFSVVSRPVVLKSPKTECSKTRQFKTLADAWSWWHS